VIADPGVTNIDPGAYVIRFGTASGHIQNGPDGIALIDTAHDQLVDALFYEGTLAPLAIDGITGTHSLVEGNRFTGADNNDTRSSLIRFPDGSDSDDAATDWSLTSTPTPGAANVMTP
jgi:hypothetical protein